MSRYECEHSDLDNRKRCEVKQPEFIMSCAVKLTEELNGM